MLTHSFDFFLGYLRKALYWLPKQNISQAIFELPCQINFLNGMEYEWDGLFTHVVFFDSILFPSVRTEFSALLRISEIARIRDA